MGAKTLFLLAIPQRRGNRMKHSVKQREASNIKEKGNIFMCRMKDHLQLYVSLGRSLSSDVLFKVSFMLCREFNFFSWRKNNFLSCSLITFLWKNKLDFYFVLVCPLKAFLWRYSSERDIMNEEIGEYNKE